MSTCGGTTGARQLAQITEVSDHAWARAPPPAQSDPTMMATAQSAPNSAGAASTTVARPFCGFAATCPISATSRPLLGSESSVPRHTPSTRTPGIAARPVRTRSTGAEAGHTTVKSSTARPPTRSSTTTETMSAPTTPSVRATCPSEPGRSGSATRSRNSIESTSRRPWPTCTPPLVYALLSGTRTGCLLPVSAPFRSGVGAGTFTRRAKPDIHGGNRGRALDRERVSAMD